MFSYFSLIVTFYCRKMKLVSALWWTNFVMTTQFSNDLNTQYVKLQLSHNIYIYSMSDTTNIGQNL